MGSVYYGFMPGTSDPVLSLALVLTPPGNLVRSIAELRRSFWTEYGATSARAYFDLPVIAWLGSPLGGAELASLTDWPGLRFGLSGLVARGRDVYAAYCEDVASACAALAEELKARGYGPNKESAYRDGPFEAGVGCYCASLQGPSLEPFSIPHPSLKAKTCLLSLVELRWLPGDGYASSWAAIAAARLRPRRA